MAWKTPILLFFEKVKIKENLSLIWWIFLKFWVLWMVLKVFLTCLRVSMLTLSKNTPTSQKIQVWYYQDSLIRRETIGWVWNIRGYFEHFQSCVTVVKMQPHWWFLVCILLEHCTLTKKWNFGLNCLQNDQFTPFYLALPCQIWIFEAWQPKIYHQYIQKMNFPKVSWTWDMLIRCYLGDLG